MNTIIARERLPYVAKPDSITASQGDFLATHVAIKRLQLLGKFELLPSKGKVYTEEDIYRMFIANPSNKHQFIAVYGQSGTGKSHLIRWFEARFAQDKPENEVVLFIRRSDNTLKGTIRQLLEKPEVQGIKNREVYEHLVRASASIAEDKLKDMIYHNFIIEINNDEEAHDITITNVKRKRLVAFLSNEIIHDRMMASNGPIERIYSKIAENTLVDRDTVAQFETEDFLVSADTYEDMRSAGADQKAERMARELMADESGLQDAKKIAQYLNQFVDEVVQRCAGIEPGDFEQIFNEIRKELFKLGKNLTLFIEDVTSFTGVDVALLNALMEEHTGMYSKANICRISSIIGSTSNYLENNFRDNHKDRVTQYVYIPSDVFDNEGVYEFVGRYLNTMSLPESTITKWLQSKAEPSEYPIHEAAEGNSWEYIEVASDKKLCLYPFTKRSIDYLYTYELTKGHQTPRYIIRDIIEPTVSDILYNGKNFPSIKYSIVNINTTLSFRIHNQVKDEQLADRLLRFMSIWGNGEPEKYMNGEITYISGIRKEIFEELGLPTIDLQEVEPSPMLDPDLGDGSDPIPNSISDPTPTPEIPADKVKRVSDATASLTKWTNGATIDVSATVGIGNIIRTARGDMCKYLFSAINWQAEGVSMDNLSKIEESSAQLIDFENQTKTRTKGFFTLPATWESLNVIAAFIRWREYGSQSWKYPDADFDAFLITSWTAKVKKDLVRAVMLYNDTESTKYIEAATAAEIYCLILNGEFREKSLKNLSSDYLFSNNAAKNTGTSHCKEWISLLNVLTQKEADKINRETVRQYFNIRQGDGGSIVVLDAINLAKTIRKVKTSKLVIEEQDMQQDDRVKLRKDVFSFLNDIVNRIENVARSEIQVALTVMTPIYTQFDTDDIDENDIIEMVDKAKEFYKTINDTQINIPTTSVDDVRKQAKQIAKALHDIGEVLKENDPLTILMAFSGDPISTLKPLTALLSQLDLDISKAEKQIEVRIAILGTYVDDDATDKRYVSELKTIDDDTLCLESLE